MAEREIDDLSYELGGIKTQLESVLRTLGEDRSAAASYRTEIRAEIRGLETKLSNVESISRETAKDVLDMKPKVQSLEERATMSKGAANLAVLLGKGMHILIGAVAGILTILFARWVKGEPPVGH